MNELKTECICIGEQETIKAKNGLNIKQIDDFQYLGSWIRNTEKDINIRIAKAWGAHKKLSCIWKSNLIRNTEIHLFRAAD